ncbi:MAG TPA: ATP-dependent Clp protease adaptor ClpS [Polyangiaceae bacterium]|nr:ATP-dependent Clp protease adaptor ClpS [Polyangiaceae bacterium]
MAERDHQFEGEILEEERTSTRKPRPWNVVLHNDDYTTMDFVQMILIAIFHHPPAAAAQLMLAVHEKGYAVAGTFTRDIAETKATEAMAMARAEGHPLKCTVEPG